MRQLSIIPLSELFITGDGPPDCATITFFDMTNFVYRFSFPASPTEALAQVGFSFIISRFANRSFSAGWFIVSFLQAFTSIPIVIWTPGGL
jgi:hypothetical protein